MGLGGIGWDECVKKIFAKVNIPVEVHLVPNLRLVIVISVIAVKVQLVLISFSAIVISLIGLKQTGHVSVGIFFSYMT